MEEAMRLDMLQKQKILETAEKVSYEDKILSEIFVSAKSVEKVKTVYFHSEEYVTETSTVSLLVTDPTPFPHSSPSTIEDKSTFHCEYWGGGHWEFKSVLEPYCFGHHFVRWVCDRYHGYGHLGHYDVWDFYP